MANYYEEVSTLLETSNEEANIICAAMDYLEEDDLNLLDEQAVNALIEKDGSIKPAIHFASLVAPHLTDYEEGERYVNIQRNIIPDKGVHFYSEEIFDSGLFSAIVQTYLSLYAPDKCFGYEGAFTCSKKRLDAFGGFAVFITQDNIESFSTDVFLSRKMSEFNA